MMHGIDLLMEEHENIIAFTKLVPTLLQKKWCGLITAPHWKGRYRLLYLCITDIVGEVHQADR